MAIDVNMTTPVARISGFLGLQRGTIGVLAVVVLVGMGEHMAERFLPIYIMALGGGAMAIGLLQAMAGNHRIQAALTGVTAVVVGVTLSSLAA